MDQVLIEFEDRSTDVVAVHEALERLSEFDPGAAQIVDLRFFCGLGVDAIAVLVGSSERTVYRDWRVARAWLLKELD